MYMYVCMYVCVPQEEVESLSEGLRSALSGKAAAETRVCAMMTDLEDKQETIEHLKV